MVPPWPAPVRAREWRPLGRRAERRCYAAGGGEDLCQSVIMTRRRKIALALVVVAVVWVFVNGPVEGPQLLVLSETHSVTTADLLSVLLVLVAIGLARPRRR